MPPPEEQFDVGATMTDGLPDGRLHETLASLRATEPVSWVPGLGAWIVTTYELASAVMRDADTFTVDDPRFATSQILGPSMLSRDGSEHGRHRDPFAAAFRGPAVQRRLAESAHDLSHAIVDELRPAGRAELRCDLAAPLAGRVMAAALDLSGVDPDELLRWYDEIVAAVTVAAVDVSTTRREVPGAVASLADAVARTVEAGSGVLAGASTSLSIDEIVSNAGVMLFGGIETSEGMTANLFTHLLVDPNLWAAVAADRSLVAKAVDESLRLEPSVVRVDRFATRDVQLGETRISRGDFVIVSIAGANRDPAMFPEPDRFDLRRPNAHRHVTFAHGPHACIGMQLAKAEAEAAVTAAIDLLPGLRLDPDAPPPRPVGTVFRKPDRVDVVWNV